MESSFLIKRLRDLLEQWYVWLSSTPDPLFQKADEEQMKNPVLYFHASIDWLSRTTISNTEWFFAEGSHIVMKRWSEEDYDAYE